LRTLCAKSKWEQVIGDVRQKYMPPATPHFESHAPRQGIWCDAMTIRTTECLQQEYPEAGITATAMPDRRDSCHSKNIPEPRAEMISGCPNPALATARLKREYSSRMKPQAAIQLRRSKAKRNTISSLRDQKQAQATFHAIPDHEGKCANRAVQLIAGRHHFRAEGAVTRRSGTGDAGSRASRVPSLPFFAINPFRKPAIPDGGR